MLLNSRSGIVSLQFITQDKCHPTHHIHHSINSHSLRQKIYICNQVVYKNRHIKFHHSFEISWLITFYNDKLWSWNFQHLLNIYLAIQQKLQNTNILFHCWVMICNVIGCSLCPHALFFTYMYVARQNSPWIPSY